MRLPYIFLPPLQQVIPYSCDEFVNISSDIVIPVGVVDNPSRQNQYIETVNLSQNNVYIMGSSQSGKTNLVQNIIRGITTLYSPKDACVYIIDCASMILRNFDNLVHVGGVVTPSEEEKLINLLKLIQESIAERKNSLSKKGLSSFSAYREAGLRELPQLIVVLENWVAFRNYFPDYEDTIVNICRESAAVGISFVVTVGQGNSAGYKLVSSFSKRIALYCNDSSDYTYIFEGCRMKIDNIAGRGIIEDRKQYYECQYYLAFDADKEYERIEQINEYIDVINNHYGNMRVKRIPEMPDSVDEEYISLQFNLSNLVPYEVPLGIDFDDIELSTLSLLHTPIVGFVGSVKSGKTEYLNYLLKDLISKSNVNPIRIYILDDVVRNFSRFENVYMYSTKPADAKIILNEVYDILQYRLEISEKGNIDAEPLILVLINSVEAMNQMTKDAENQDKFRNMVSLMDNMKISILATNILNSNVIYGMSEMVKHLKDIKRYIVFENIKDIKVCPISPDVVRVYKKIQAVGDAYNIIGDDVSKIKTIH